MTIIPRTVAYSGTFFTSGLYGIDEGLGKTDEDMRSSTTYTIIARTINDTWVPDIASDDTKRQTLIDAVLASDKTSSTTGYESAMEAAPAP